MPASKLALVLALSLASASALAQSRDLTVRALGGSCGASVERGTEPATTIRTTANTRGQVTITLAHLRFYCAPLPRFDARMLEDGTIVLTAREPEAPVARCMCEHRTRVRIDGVPPGVHPIEVRFRDELRVRGEVTVASARPPSSARRQPAAP